MQPSPAFLSARLSTPIQIAYVAVTRLVVVLFAAVFLAGCSVEQMMERAAAEPEARYAREALDALRLGQLGAFRERFLDPAAAQELEERMTKLSAVYPGGPGQIKLVHFKMRDDLKGRVTHDFTFDSAYPDTHVLTKLVVVSMDGRMRLEQVSAARAQPEAALTFRNVTVTHTVFLMLSAVNLMVIGLALARWFRARRALARRWVWLAAILVGVGGVGLNWSTGQIESFRLGLQLLGIGFSRDVGGSWMLQVSIPVGAIWFLLRRGAGRAILSGSTAG